MREKHTQPKRCARS